MDGGRERGRGGREGRGRRGGTDGRLVLPLVSFIPRLWSASVSPFGRGSSWRGEGWRDGGMENLIDSGGDEAHLSGAPAPSFLRPD